MRMTEIRNLRMKKEENQELNQFCKQIKEHVEKGKLGECEQMIPQYMQKYPDSAIPHNLLGIVLEKQGRHVEAMKHFRAAAALDAEFLPASYNMEQYSSLRRKCAIEPMYGWEEYRSEHRWNHGNTLKRESEYSNKKGMFMHETGKTDHWILV